jgi:phosphoribosylamine--glycine ligase
MRTATGGRGAFSVTGCSIAAPARLRERLLAFAPPVRPARGKRLAMARVLLVGSGSREHALASGIASSAGGPHEILVAPGNAGTAALARNVAVAADDVPGLVELAAREQVDLVVVGPEAPLVAGLVDALEARGIRAFGPSKQAAQLEGSKAFMKGVLGRHGIPTAGFAVFDDAEAAKAHVRAAARPLVVKADGLCAGKGVVVAASVDEALEAIDHMMVARAFGAAGARVVIEDILPGEEASFHVICDGTRAFPLVSAQDHKRALDGDRGPNTGGMGAYAPAPVVTPAVHARVMETIVEPTLRGMAAEGMPFRGVLFVGLMIEGDVPRVLEFNVRFGDPETTVLVPMLDGDWLALLDGAARGDLGAAAAASRTHDGAALAVVMAAEGYPGKPTTGDAIDGLDAPLPPGAFVFHAGTKRDGDRVVTAGGRILTVGARGASLPEARAKAYDAVSGLRFRGEQHRTDIGHRALARG